MDGDGDEALTYRIDEKRIARRVGRLAQSRLVAASTVFGLSVATAIFLVAAFGLMFTGKFVPVSGATGALALFALIIAPVAAFVPWADRRMLSGLREATGPDICVPLLIQMNGVYVGRARRSVEWEFARLLGTVNEEWWHEQRRVWNQQVRAALRAARDPDFLHPVNGPWLPALLDAIARCGRTELLGHVEKLDAAATRRSFPPALREAARRCAESLRERKERNALSATLLRPAEAQDAALLRPAGVALNPNEPLLRPATLSGVEVQTASHLHPQEVAEGVQSVGQAS